MLLIFLVLITSCSQNHKDAADFFLKGNVALTHKNYPEALRLYDEAIAKNAEFSDAYLNKGIVLLKLHKPGEACEVLTKAIELDPTLLQANLVRAETALMLGQLKDAEADLNALAKNYKDSSRYHLIRGDVATARSNDPEALAEYDLSISLDQNNTEALVNRGALHYKMGLYNQAKNDFAAALKIDPSQPQALNNMGLIYIKHKEWKTAIGYFDIVLSKTPNDALCLNNKGYALLRSGQMEEGRKLIERSLIEMPTNTYALRNLGIYFQLKKDFAQAVLHFEKAMKPGEPVEHLYGLAGQAYLAQGRQLDACKIWKQGIILKDSIAISEAGKNCR